MPRLVIALGLFGLIGCASNQHLALHSNPKPAPLESATTSLANSPTAVAATQVEPIANSATVFGPSDSPVDFSQLVVGVVTPVQATTPIVVPADELGEFEGDASISKVESSAPSLSTVDLNLPTALAMVGGQHPVVGFAQWRTQEAYAQLARAEALWLPSIQSGFGFHRHDGNLQASGGDIVDVNRNSFQYGLGTGAVGAGTTPAPGIVAQFHLADAIFQPEIAEKTAWARGHAAKAVLNQQLLHAALAYIELLDAHQDARILVDSRDRTAALSKITDDFAKAGQGLQADADRMQTELSLIENRLIAARERMAVASARLAQAISIESSSQIQPMDVTAVPLDLVAERSDMSSLIGNGLSMRPELKESQALVAAACEEFKRQKYAPFVPSILLGYSTSGFGGGVGSNINNVDGRYDLDAVMTWQVRNLGFSERALRRESTARIQQAKFETLRVMDQVALEISESFSQVEFRRQQIAITQQAIRTAEKSYESNLRRIREGQGLPIEVLQAVQAAGIGSPRVLASRHRPQPSPISIAMGPGLAQLSAGRPVRRDWDGFRVGNAKELFHL